MAVLATILARLMRAVITLNTASLFRAKRSSACPLPANQNSAFLPLSLLPCLSSIIAAIRQLERARL